MLNNLIIRITSESKRKVNSTQAKIIVFELFSNNLTLFLVNNNQL